MGNEEKRERSCTRPAAPILAWLMKRACLSLIDRSSCALKEWQRTRWEIAQDIGVEKSASHKEEAATRSVQPAGTDSALSTLHLPRARAALASRLFSEWRGQSSTSPQSGEG